MIIKVLMKSISKTRGIDTVDYEVVDNIVALRDLIINLCAIEIDKYENKEFKVLNQEDINNMVNSGKGMLPMTPVHSQKRGHIFLPFVDEDPKTAEIITKVMMLAKGDKLNDPTILQYLR